MCEPLKEIAREEPIFLVLLFRSALSRTAAFSDPVNRRYDDRINVSQFGANRDPCLCQRLSHNQYDTFTAKIIASHVENAAYNTPASEDSSAPSISFRKSVARLEFYLCEI